jgi:DNA-binding winged helix-turn-helix (wHTH) protein/Tfp pilus assembly protein PilF
LEPKVAELLFLLADNAGQALSREQLMCALWPGVVVGEDSLARAVFKLRGALGDDARAPRYIETLSKRGYRCIAAVAMLTEGSDPQWAPAAWPPASAQPESQSVPPATVRPGSPRRRGRAATWLVLALLPVVCGLAWFAVSSGESPVTVQQRSLTARADDFYFQFSRSDNEAAIELYERVLGGAADDVHALAGLANALVQRAIRWPRLPGATELQFSRLGDALAHGHLSNQPYAAQLQRARNLAERAAALAPQSSVAHKAVGFVASAQGRLDDALAAHQRAVELDPEAWGALINIGDVLEIQGHRAEALPWFERAYAAMDRTYAQQSVQIRPWHAALGAVIAERHAELGEPSLAEAWYRRVLTQWPLHPQATRGLASLLRAAGDEAQADGLCAQLVQRTGQLQGCGDAADPADPARTRR